MRRKPVVAIVLLGVTGAAILALRLWSSGDLTASEALAKSQAAEEQVLAQVREGKVLHIRDEVYRRHGPAASLIRDMSSEWYLPERYVHELWLKVGDGGKITDVRGFVKSDTGELLQNIATAGSEVITQDVAGGAEFRTPLQLSVEDMAKQMAISAEQRREQIASDMAVVAGYGMIGDRATLIVEEAVPSPSTAANVDDGYSEGYSVPYVGDIKPVKWLRRSEVDRESLLPLRWSIVVVDAGSNETVAEQKHRTAFEVVDQGLEP